MGREKYVGRVGALAVALGIGTAVVALSGVAWAEPEGSTSPGTSQDGSSDDKPAPTDKRSRATDPEDTEDAPSTKRSANAEKSNADADDATAEDEDSSSEITEEPATVVRPLSSPRRTAKSADEPEEPAGATPLLWTLLSGARRQFGEQSHDTNSAATESNSVQTTAEPADTTSPVLPGDSYQSPVIAADGTTYQVLSDLDSTRVVVLDSTGQVLATSRDIRGSESDVNRAVARPDGTLIVVTGSGFGTTISSVNKEGAVRRIAWVGGTIDEPVTVGANGALYFSTSTLLPIGPVPPSVGLRTYRISPLNTVRSFAHDTEVQLAADGSAALVSSQFGFSTLRVIAANGTTRLVPLPFGSDPSGPILGDDGTVYVTAGVTPFGVKQTRLYTVSGSSRTVRSVTGLPGRTVVAVDGLYLETFTHPGSTDDGTGTTYVSRITPIALSTSDAIDGRIAGMQVAPDGTVYTPIIAPSGAAPVAVVDPDGNVVTVTLPGTLVVGGRNVRGGSSQGSDGFGYVNYTANGTEHVAVLDADGDVVRTIDLPPGASGGSVFYGPDGTAYQLLIYSDDEGQPVSRQILTLPTTTYTAVVPGRTYYRNSGVADVVFGTNGVGYLLTGALADGLGGMENLDVLGFTPAGDTAIRVTGLPSPVIQVNSFGGTLGRCLGRCGSQVLAFDPDGTAYVTVFNSQVEEYAVYALTPSGAVKVADLVYTFGDRGHLPTFAADGTGYVTTGSFYSPAEFAASRVTVFPPLG